jgi:hypothetical protein
MWQCKPKQSQSEQKMQGKVSIFCKGELNIPHKNILPSNQGSQYRGKHICEQGKSLIDRF